MTVSPLFTSLWTCWRSFVIKPLTRTMAEIHSFVMSIIFKLFWHKLYHIESIHSYSWRLWCFEIHIYPPESSEWGAVLQLQPHIWISRTFQISRKANSHHITAIIQSIWVTSHVINHYFRITIQIIIRIEFSRNPSQSSFHNNKKTSVTPVQREGGGEKKATTISKH